MSRISPRLTTPGPDHQPLTWSSCFCFSYTVFIPDAWRSLTKAPHGTRLCKPDMVPCCHQGENQSYTSKLSCVTSSPVWPHLPILHPRQTHWFPCSPSFTKAAPHWGISMWCSLSPTEAAGLIPSPPPSPSVITFSVKSAPLTTASDTASLSLPLHTYTHSYHRYTPHTHTPIGMPIYTHYGHAHTHPKVCLYTHTTHLCTHTLQAGTHRYTPHRYAYTHIL